MKRINRSMICREISSLAKGIPRGSVNRGGTCDGHDSGLTVIKFNCKLGQRTLTGPTTGGESVSRCIFATREDVINAAHTIHEMTKTQRIISIIIYDYVLYEGIIVTLQAYNSTNTIYNYISDGNDYVTIFFGEAVSATTNHTIDANGELIESVDSGFITEEYASTISGLAYSAEAPYGSLIIVVAP